jgi:L-rhamnonate dehydratase
MLQKLDEFDLDYVEQPLHLDDLSGHAALRWTFSTPVALDESAYTMQDALAIIRTEAADVLLLDPHQAGGMHRCRKAAAVAEATGLPVTLHSGAELGVSTAAYLHLAASIPNLMLAVDSQYENQAGDVVSEPHRVERGTMNLPGAPGLVLHQATILKRPKNCGSRLFTRARRPAAAAARACSAGKARQSPRRRRSRSSGSAA